MNTVNIVPRCDQCGKHPTVFSVSVSHEGTHTNLYLETICVVCTKERTIKWSLEQLAYYAFKLLDNKSEDIEKEPDPSEVN